MITTIDNLSDSARILSLLSDGQWHSNDELYEISRRPGSIIFTLKERGVSLEKKKDENIRFREHWRITKPIPEELKVVDGKIRHSSG